MEEGEGEDLESAIVIDEVLEKKKTITSIVPDAPPLVMGPKPPAGGDVITVTDLTNKPPALEQIKQESSNVQD